MKMKVKNVFIQVSYRFKGERYVAAFPKDEVLDKLEELTKSGAVITKVINYDR